MREARNPNENAELLLDFDQIMVVIVSLLKGQEETTKEGFVQVASVQAQLVDYLLGVVEESYNDRLFNDLDSFVKEMRQDLGL